MLIAKGEVRRVIDDSYVNKNTGEQVIQQCLIIEPDDGKDNLEITLNSHQVKSGAASQWQVLKGKQSAIKVRILSFKNGGYKLIALDDAKPLQLNIPAVAAA